MTPGEKKTLKFQMMMSPQEAELLDDWMFANKVRSRAEAIRRLWTRGLAAENIHSPRLWIEPGADEEPL